jgi:maleylacetate reductase
MTSSGRVVFSQMDEVIFGMPAAQQVADLARRAGAERVLLMVSGTLNRETDEIARIRAALGNTCAAVFDRVPPHTPREAVIEAAEMARNADVDLIVTVGGGSVTDAAKAVQLCLANTFVRRRRWMRCVRRMGPMAQCGRRRATRRQYGRSPSQPRYRPGSSAQSLA